MVMGNHTLRWSVARAEKVDWNRTNINERIIRMKKTLNSRALVIGLTIALLCLVLGPFGVGAPTFAEKEAPATTLSINDPAITRTANDQPFLPADFAKSEAESINKFGLQVIDYRDHFETVSNATSPDATQLAAVERKLNDLKTKFPRFQSDARSLVTKLKSAGKWTKELDSYFEAAAAKNAPPEFLDQVKAEGGLRSALDKQIAALHKFSDELDRDSLRLRDLKTRKVSWLHWADSLLVSTAHARIGRLSCDTCLTVFIVMATSCGLFLSTAVCAASSAAYLAGGCARSACQSARLTVEPRPNQELASHD